jgi:hypothetical protein
MKILKFLLAIAMLSGAGIAWADRHAHAHVFIGVPFGPWIYPPPYYYYYPPRIVVAPAAPPPVYIEQQQAPATSGFWYYCASSRAYYPYVKECPEGWMQESPKPQN